MKKILAAALVSILLVTSTVYALSYYQNGFDDAADLAEFTEIDVNSSLSVSLSGGGDPVTSTLKAVQTLGGEDDKVVRIVTGIPDDEYVYVSACVYVPDFQAPAIGSRGLAAWSGGWYHDNLVAGNSDFEQLSIYLQKVASSPSNLEVWLYMPQGTSYWDDVRVSTEPPPPCASIGGAAPTVTPTATPVATGTPSVDIATFVDIPGPLPLEPIDSTIDLAPFWDVGAISQAVSVIQTFFYLENIPEFFRIFLLVMGIIIGLRLIFAIIGARQTAARNDGPEV